LEARVGMAKDLTDSDYTSDSWATYADALGNAKNVLNDPNATQAKIDTAYTTLKNAQDNLQSEDEASGVDKTALDNKLTDVSDLKKGDYTADSWAKFEGEKSAARSVLNNEGATQEEVDQAL